MHGQRPIKCKVARGPNGVWVGIGALPVGTGQLTVQETVDEAPIRRKMERRVMNQYGAEIIRAYRAMKEAHDALHDEQERAAISGEYEISGIFGDAFKFAKDAFNETVGMAKLTLKAVVNKEARKKLIEKIGQGVAKAGKIIKTVYEHPVFAGVVGVLGALTAPLGIGGPLIAGYALSRAALKLAEGIVAGDPSALLTAGQLAAGAAQAAGTPGAAEAANALAEVAKAKAAIEAGPGATAAYVADTNAGRAIRQGIPGISPDLGPPYTGYAADRARLAGLSGQLPSFSY